MFKRAAIHKKAQSTVELATLGAVLLLVCSAVFSYAQSYRVRQDLEMKAFRSTCHLASKESGGTSVSMQWYFTLPTTTLQNPFAMSDQTYSTSSFLTMNCGSDLNSRNIIAFGDQGLDYNIDLDQHVQEKVEIWKGYLLYTEEDNMLTGSFTTAPTEPTEETKLYERFLDKVFVKLCNFISKPVYASGDAIEDPNQNPDDDPTWPGGLPKELWGKYEITLEDIYASVEKVDSAKAGGSSDAAFAQLEDGEVTNSRLTSQAATLHHHVTAEYKISTQLYNELMHDLNIIEGYLTYDIDGDGDEEEVNDPEAFADARGKVIALRDGDMFDKEEFHTYQCQRIVDDPYFEVEAHGADEPNQQITRRMSKAIYWGRTFPDEHPLAPTTIGREQTWRTPVAEE